MYHSKINWKVLSHFEKGERLKNNDYSVSDVLKTHKLGVNQFYRKNGARKRESDHATDN